MKLNISSNSAGFASTINQLYNKDPDVTINFLNTFGGNISCDYNARHLAEYIELFNIFKKKNIPQDHLEVIKRSMSKCIDNLLYEKINVAGSVLSDVNIINLYKIFDSIPEDVKRKFGDLFVKSFAYSYKYRRAYMWDQNVKYSKGLTKTAYKKIMHDLIENDHVDIYDFIARAAYALPLNGLREFANKHTEKGLDDPKIMDILRNVPEFCHLTYTEEDMKNASKRRGLLRRATNKNSVIKNRLRFMVTFSCEDIRGINIENRWEFLSVYYGFQYNKSKGNWYCSEDKLFIKGYGPKLKLERNPTYDEMEQLLFPLIIAGYEEYEEPCKQFMELYAKFCNDKNKVTKKRLR